MKLDDNQIKVLQNRYFQEGEDWDGCSYRVASAMARKEKDYNKYLQSFVEIINQMYFLPAGRILRNAGTQRQSLFNCFVLPCGDSIEEIFINWKAYAAILWADGGGVGVNLSNLRPEGTEVKSKGPGASSSGPVSFLLASDADAQTIKTGGDRRAAGMAMMNVSHPDISKFIDAKLKDGIISNYNISVAATEDFFEAVEKDSDWQLKFNQQNFKKVKAKEIWDKILSNMIKCAEPGLINWTNLTSNNSYYCSPICSTNPCIIGDTLIATADGRNVVSIKQLAKEKRDVLVYSTNLENGKTEIKWGRNPRKTGNQKEVWKLILDDESYLIATPDHEILTKDLKYKKLKDLQVNDLILPFNSFKFNNHKVKCVEFYGYEDVYNITIDDNHNYYIITSSDNDKNYISSSGICIKNCGEVPLSAYGNCCLGSLILPNFIANKNTNWKKLEEVVRLAVRFLDNVIDASQYTLNEVDKTAHETRRIGLGYLGVAEYLFAKQIRYGSPKAIAELEKLGRFIRNITYDENVKLAVEKGAFPKFEPVQYGKAHFIRTLPTKLRMAIKKYGVRCVTTMALAPNGTIGLVAGYTGGVEPLFYKAYKRKDRIGERVYIHPKYKELLLSGDKIPDWFVDSSDLIAEDHLETQTIVQRNIDGAVSKTINMPKGTTKEQLSELLLEYIRDLKGVTVYVDGSREGQIVNKISEEEVREYLSKEQKTNSSMDEDLVTCKSGICEI